MPTHRYRKENGSAVIMAARRLAGVIPEVNCSKYVTDTPSPSMKKVAHSGFETQRHHQKSKTGVLVAPQKGPMSSKN